MICSRPLPEPDTGAGIGAMVAATPPKFEVRLEAELICTATLSLALISSWLVVSSKTPLPLAQVETAWLPLLPLTRIVQVVMEFKPDALTRRFDRRQAKGMTSWQMPSVVVVINPKSPVTWT